MSKYMSDFDKLRDLIQELEAKEFMRGYHTAICVILDHVAIGETVTAEKICQLAREHQPRNQSQYELIRAHYDNTPEVKK